MPLGIEIRIPRDDATPALARVRAGLQPEALRAIVGRSAVNTVRAHLFGVNQSRPNRLGGPRTNFYTQAARATSFRIVGDAVVVSIASVGIAQRYFGGTIRPVTKKFLTIPARAEAYGKRAGEFQDLEVLVGRNGPYALARRSASLISIGRRGADGRRAIGRRGSQGGEILFWLVKEVTQKPDPTVLPYNEQIEAAAQRDLTAYVNRLAERSGGTN